MFGLVTKAQLAEYRRELKAEIDECRRLQEEIAYEWAKWFGKFRSLYAMLLKRERAPGAASTPDGASPTVEQPEPMRGNPRALELLEKRRRNVSG